jgi:ABC-type lipoprotein export system ATPase subunit
MSDPVSVISLRGVTKEYPDASGSVKVLDNLDFELSASERVAIVGPSGCGKSTLLNIMGLLDEPSAGYVAIKGQDVSSISPGESARLRNLEIGFVFQMHHLLPQCTVIENAILPALPSGNTVEARERAEILLRRVGLAEKMNNLPEMLSGGERQRAAVVRALINRPALLLADEPTGSLNEEGAKRLTDLMLELNEEEDMALAVVTHSNAIASQIGLVLELHEGRLRRKA